MATKAVCSVEESGSLAASVCLEEAGVHSSAAASRGVHLAVTVADTGGRPVPPSRGPD